MRDSFVFYRSFYEAIRDLPRDVQGEIYTAIMEYGLYGKETEQLKPIARSIFILLKPIIDANNSRHENAKKGGAPKGICNNPNGRRGKVRTNQEQTENKPRTNQEQTENLPNVDVDVDVNYNKETISNDIVKKDESFSPSIQEFKIDYSKVESLWNNICTNLPKIQELSTKRKEKVRLRLKEMGNSYQKLETILTKLNQSDFCKGNNSSSWKATFDWLFGNPNNWIKVLEGNYDNNKGSYGKTTSQNQQYGFKYYDQTTEISSQSDI